MESSPALQREEVLLPYAAPRLVATLNGLQAALLTGLGQSLLLLFGLLAGVHAEDLQW